MGGFTLSAPRVAKVESSHTSTLVEAGLTKWNRIKAELMEMYQIVTATKIVTFPGI